MRPLSLRLLLAGLLAGSVGPALAQGEPNADQIIQMLKPQGQIGAQTRGIHRVPAADAAAPTPEAAAAKPSPVAKPAAAEPVAAAPSVSLNVQFRTGSAELSPAAIQSLDNLGRALSSQTLAAYRFRIEGHTDTVGSPEANKALSQRRAEAVAAYLASHYSVDRARLDPVGMGEDGLLVPTPPQTAEPRNRRVQVVNTGA